MTSTVWLIYDTEDNHVVNVCATAKDCAYHLVELNDAMDGDWLMYLDEDNYYCQTSTSVREAAQKAKKSNLDFLIEVLEGHITGYWLPWRIEQEQVFGGYDCNLK